MHFSEAVLKQLADLEVAWNPRNMMQGRRSDDNVITLTLRFEYDDMPAAGERCESES